jgi:hypothetical protein
MSCTAVAQLPQQYASILLFFKSAHFKSAPQ